MKKCIALSGTAGIGKTSLGKALASHYKLDFAAEDIGQIIEKSKVLSLNNDPKKTHDLLQEYLYACNAWIEQRSFLISKSNIVLDRFALDILNRIVISNHFKDNSVVIQNIAQKVHQQAQSIDILIIPHIHLPGVPVINDQGMQRKQSYSQRLLSHSTSIGLAKIYCPCPTMFLPPHLVDFDKKVEKVIEHIDRLKK